MQVIRQVKNTKCYLIESVMSVNSCMTNSSDNYVDRTGRRLLLWLLGCCSTPLTKSSDFMVSSHLCAKVVYFEYDNLFHLTNQVAEDQR